MQTSIRSTTDSTQHGDLPRTENDGGNSWKRLRSSPGLARDDDDDDIPTLVIKKVVALQSWAIFWRTLYSFVCVIVTQNSYRSAQCHQLQ